MLHLGFLVRAILEANTFDEVADFYIRQIAGSKAVGVNLEESG
jgi:hypothetical protein